MHQFLIFFSFTSIFIGIVHPVKFSSAMCLTLHAFFAFFYRGMISSHCASHSIRYTHRCFIFSLGIPMWSNRQVVCKCAHMRSRTSKGAWIVSPIELSVVTVADHVKDENTTKKNDMMLWRDGKKSYKSLINTALIACCCCCWIFFSFVLKVFWMHQICAWIWILNMLAHEFLSQRLWKLPPVAFRSEMHFTFTHICIPVARAHAASVSRALSTLISCIRVETNGERECDHNSMISIHIVCVCANYI